MILLDIEPIDTNVPIYGFIAQISKHSMSGINIWQAGIVNLTGFPYHC